MDLKEIREALQQLKGKVVKDLEQDAIIGVKGFGSVQLDANRMKAFAAIDILDDYLDMEIIQEALDAYSDEELEAMGRPHNLMGILIEARKIKLTPTPGGKGVNCLAYKDTADENGCHICAYQKTCFPDGLPFAEQPEE